MVCFFAFSNYPNTYLITALQSLSICVGFTLFLSLLNLHHIRAHTSFFQTRQILFFLFNSLFLHYVDRLTDIKTVTSITIALSFSKGNFPQ